MKLLKNNHLTIVAVLAMLGVVASFMPAGLLRTLFTLPLVLVLPGYAMMAAFFPKRLASYPGNILFVTTWSLAMTSLGTLLLHKTDAGLSTATWAFWLGGVTLIGLVIAAWRQDDIYARSHIWMPRAYQVLLLAVAVGLGVFALHTARVGVEKQERPGFTQLWMMPATDENRVDVGAQNQEGLTVAYMLTVQGADINMAQQFELKPGESWETTLDVPGASGQKIDAKLYRMDDPDTVYRSTELWLPQAGVNAGLH